MYRFFALHPIMLYVPMMSNNTNDYERPFVIYVSVFVCLYECVNYPVQTNARSSGFVGKLESFFLVLLLDLV